MTIRTCAPYGRHNAPGDVAQYVVPLYAYTARLGRLFRYNVRAAGLPNWQPVANAICTQHTYRSAATQRPAGCVFICTLHEPALGIIQNWYRRVTPAPLTEAAPDRASDAPNTPASQVGAGPCPFVEENAS